MLNFLAKTENLRNTRPERPNEKRGKVVKFSSGKLLFAISELKNIDIQLDQSEPSVER